MNSPPSTAEATSSDLAERQLEKLTDAVELESKLKWLLLVRFLFLVSLTLVVLLLVLSVSGPIPATGPLLLVAGAGLVLTLLYVALFMSKLASPAVQAYIQFSGDLLLASALVYGTGGATSSFSMVYLMVIASAATILRRRAGITIAEIAWLLYAATVVSVYQGWFGASDLVDGTAAVTSVGRLAYALFVHLVGFYGVALLTSILSNRVAQAEHELAVATGDLEELEIYHRDVVESMSSGLILVDLQDRVININRTGRSILGLDRSLEGDPLLDLGLFEPEHWDKLRRAAGAERIRDEVDFRGDDGTQRYVGFSVGVIRDADENVRGYSVVFQDLTDWRRLQTELSFNERMAAVGELAAGLAHEIGNPLAAISGSVQMLRGSGRPDSADDKLLDIVLKESQRLDRTIKGFLKFAKPHERNDQRFDICELISENATLLRNSDELQDLHEVKLDLDPPEQQIVADRDQIAQVFWNLARNAIRAMPAGGCLTLRGRSVAVEESMFDSGDLSSVMNSLQQEHRSRGFYSLSFEDEGEGMTEEQRHNLFHPFTSHKGGTGIGMAIVYRVVDAHHGQIRVDSGLGKGTKVEIRLPL